MLRRRVVFFRRFFAILGSAFFRLGALAAAFLAAFLRGFAVVVFLDRRFRRLPLLFLRGLITWTLNAVCFWYAIAQSIPRGPTFRPPPRRIQKLGPPGRGLP